MSAAQGWDRNRRRGGGAAGGASGVSGAGAAGGGRGTGQLNRFVQLSGRPHLPGEWWGRCRREGGGRRALLPLGHTAEDREAEHQEGGVEVRRGTGARLKKSLTMSTAR